MVTVQEGQVASLDEQLFALPAEVRERIQQQANKEKRTPTIIQEPVAFDHTPLSIATDVDVSVQMAADGVPMVLRSRRTKTTLYRADGREAVVAVTQRQKLLNKVDKAGKHQFFTNPPMKVPANTAICRYCFKKFRPSTAVEIASNAAKPQLDEEALRLLTEQYPGMTDNTSASINDVHFKLAEHVRVRHGRLAAFTGDPLFKRIQGSGSEVASQELSAFAPDQPKRGRGRPRKNV